jgi:hypothetical protein
VSLLIEIVLLRCEIAATQSDHGLFGNAEFRHVFNCLATSQSPFVRRETGGLSPFPVVVTKALALDDRECDLGISHEITSI